MEIKICVTRRWPAAVEKALSELGAVTLNLDDKPLDSQQLAAALTEYDVVCPTVTDKITADMLNQSGLRVRLLANFGVGYNHIDVSAAESAGIAVTNTPGVLTQATAELALMLTLMVARRAGEGEREVRADAWQGWRPTHLLGTQVTGKTLGIIGMGRIGLALARKAHHGLGMHIAYFNRGEVEADIQQELQCTRMELPELMRQSDFVSVHCPATPQTWHLIDAPLLAQMQSHAFLINTARGDVVDEAALFDALSSRAIAGAGLDVYEQEPRLTDGLARLDNVVLLPHLGSATTETRSAMGYRCLENVKAWLNQKPLPDRVQITAQ